VLDELLESLVFVAQCPHLTTQVVILTPQLLNVRLTTLHFRVDFDGAQTELFVLVEHSARRALVQLAVGFDARILLPRAQHFVFLFFC
jgi:hypothetical protein